MKRGFRTDVQRPARGVSGHPPLRHLYQSTYAADNGALAVRYGRTWEARSLFQISVLIQSVKAERAQAGRSRPRSTLSLPACGGSRGIVVSGAVGRTRRTLNSGAYADPATVRPRTHTSRSPSPSPHQNISSEGTTIVEADILSCTLAGSTGCTCAQCHGRETGDRCRSRA